MLEESVAERLKLEPREESAVVLRLLMSLKEVEVEWLGVALRDKSSDMLLTLSLREGVAE